MTSASRAMTATWVWLGLGYTAYYFCRTTLPVVRPYLLQELVAGGMSPDDARRALGAVVSWSLLAAAIGKFGAGILIDRGGGRKTFVLGGLGVAASTFVQSTKPRYHSTSASSYVVRLAIRDAYSRCPVHVHVIGPSLSG